MNKNFTYIAIGLLIIFIGFAVLGYSYNQYKISQDLIDSSQSTSGEVINSNIDREIDSQDDSNVYEYHFTINYKYTVDGQEYTNNNISPVTQENVFDSRSGANNYKSSHSIGDPITVYYIPEDPKTSFIEKSSSSPITMIIVSIAFILTGILMAVVREDLEQLKNINR